MDLKTISGWQAVLVHFAEDIGLPPNILNNLILTVIVIVTVVLIRRTLQGYIAKRIEAESTQEAVEDLLPQLAKLIGIGALLKIWLSGEGSFASFFAVSPHTMEQIVATIWVVLFYLALRSLGEVFIDLRNPSDNGRRFSKRKGLHLALGILSALFLFKVWVATTADLSTYFGLLSAGVAIALQDPLASLAAWLYLNTVKPLRIGDRVQVGEHRGDVTDVGLFQFSVMETGNWVAADQPTGRILQFPNSYVFKNVVANYNVGFDYIWSEMPVLVTFESDWEKARDLLDGIVERIAGRSDALALKQIRRAERQMRLMIAQFDARIIVSVADSGVVLTPRFLVSVRKRRDMESRIWVAILEAFAKEDSIDFAYPTKRYYINNQEGKSGAGGPV